MNSSIQDIYDHLCDGKTVKMSFPNTVALQNFKSALHQYRTSICETLESLGEYNEKTVNELITTAVTEDSDFTNDTIIVKFNLRPKKINTYIFEILDE
jgi:hypothetical protein